MASLVLGVAGAAIGSMMGPMGAQIGFALGSAAGGLLFPPKGPDGPRLNDLSVQTSTYGKGIPIPYGTTRIAGNIIWADKIVEHEHEEGGSGGPEYTVYSYTCSFAVSICVGPIAGITRIWADGLLIYDVRPENTGEQFAFKAGGHKLYLGTETQLPDPTIQALIGDTPAYRGQAHFVFTDLELGKFGNRLPSLSFEVVHTAAATTLPPPEPFIESGSAMMALDPVSGYLFVPMAGAVTVYDPATRTIVATIGVSGGAGWATNPYGIIYYNGQIIVGNSAPAFFDVLGWVIDPGTLTATTIMRIPDPSESPPPPGGAYFWPGLPSKEGVFFGTGGLYEGASFDSSNGRRGPSMSSPGGNVMVSPDGTTEIFLGQTSGFMGMDLVLDSAGLYHQFRLTLGVPAGEGAPSDGHKVAWNDEARTLYYGHSAQTGVYEFSRIDGAMRLVIPDVKPEIILYSPDTNLVYVQDDRTTNFASYRVTTEGYFPKVEDYPGAGVGTIGLHSTAIYLGDEEWAVSGGSSGEVWSLTFANTLAGGPAPLADIVTDISLRAGLTPADIDVSELTDMVDGYCITHQMAARSALEPLMQAYFFDPVESDYKIKFRKRGRPAVVTIPDDDLAAHSSGSEPPDLIEIRRKQELDLPQVVNVKYINPAADYQTSTQYEARQTGRSNSPVTVDLPIVMSDEKAKQVASAALYTAWAERTGLSFATTLAYAKYEPTDCFIVHNRLVRIVHRKRNGGIIEWEGYADGNTIYPSETVNQGGAAAPAGPVGQELVTTPPTRVQLMDTPMLPNTDGSPGFVVAAQGTNVGWTGAQIFKSIDGGLSYQPLISVPNASIMGTAVNALAPYTGGDTFDELNTVTISLPTSSPVSTLASATELAVLNGANAALLGDELIQYKRAVLNDDGTVTLSGLLRYRRGTDYATHTAGERFVALGSGAVQVPVSTAEIGLPRQYKAVSNGGTLASAQAVTLTYTGADLKPYSPVHIGGWRDAAGDLALTWVRRTRIGGEWRDGIDVPLGEATEAYDVEILNGAGAVVRTFSGVTSPTVTYTAADQVADFTAPQSSVTVRVYQLSSVVGRGFPGTGSV